MRKWALPLLVGYGLTTASAEVLPDVIEQVELRVVGVYRPLDLGGRFIRVPREVFLQSSATAEAMRRLVGKTITVHRTVDVPASINMETKVEKARRLAEARKKRPRQKRRRPRRHLEPSQPHLQAEGNRTGAFAAPRVRQRVAMDEIVRIPVGGVTVQSIEIAVGQVEVMAVRGDVAVARVISDGVGDEKTTTVAVFGGQGLAETPAIMSGDLARYEVKRPPKVAAPVQDEEIDELDEDLELLEREARRRQQRLRRFQRQKIKWNL